MISLPDVSSTRRLGARLADALRPGDTVALLGELGAGKTTLVDACVRALGGEGAHSPTFSLVHEYPCGPRAPVRAIWHVDLYRIERERELEELGLEEFLGSAGGAAFVEWADRFAVLPADHLVLRLHHAEDGRAAELDGRGARGEALARALYASLATELAPGPPAG
ncbi:MAG: tRNA (adenosine(37)-N6)-threonylcarbamoyltransferase complex ATPase subunit type 1 TsaE [Kofleriaceae bacterium]